MGSQTKYFLWIDLLLSLFCGVESVYFWCFLTFVKSKESQTNLETPSTWGDRYWFSEEQARLAAGSHGVLRVESERFKGSLLLPLLPSPSQEEWLFHTGQWFHCSSRFLPLWEAVSSSYWRALAVLCNLCFGADNHRLAEHCGKVVDPDLVHPFALKAASAAQPFTD